MPLLQHGLRRLGWATARPGQSLVIAALSFTALIGMVALGVDVGNLWLQQRMLRTVADGAALVGAQGYDGAALGSWPVTTAGAEAAKNYAEARAGVACGYGAGAAEPCKIITPVTAYGAQGNQYIQVIIRKTVPFSFARVLGYSSQDLTLTSTARTNRPQPSDFAIIALGPNSTDGIQIERGTSTNRYMVVGGSDIASWTNIFRVGSNSTTVSVAGGQAYHEVGFVPSSGVTIPAPVVQAGIATLAEDPFDGVPLPNPPFCADRGVDLSPPSTDNVFRYCGADFLSVGPGQTVTLEPGSYGVVIVNGGTVKFVSGEYIFQVFNALDLSEPTDPTTYARVIMDDPTDPAGIYVGVARNWTMSGFILFNLRGRANRRDILWRYTGSDNGGFTISLNNDLASIANGSIYARNAGVLVQGNVCNRESLDAGITMTSRFARLSRGLGGSGGSITTTGGRVVAARVRLWHASSLGVPACSAWLGVAWGIDYPPINTNRQPAPTLVPNAP